MQRKSMDSLESGKVDAAAGRLDSAISRYYYSFFQKVAALMVLKSLSTSKHTHVRSFVNRELGKCGLLPVECVRMYNKLMDFRQDADYSYDNSIGIKELTLVEENLTDFHTSMDKLISKEINSLARSSSFGGDKE